MTLKEIAIELLEKYEAAESGFIWEYSSDIRSSEKSLKEEIKRYRKMIEKADRKTEPSDSENPNNCLPKRCETCKHRDKEWDDYPCDACCGAHSGYEPKTEPQTCRNCKWSQTVCRLGDSPPCHSYELKTEPQTDCAWR